MGVSPREEYSGRESGGYLQLTSMTPFLPKEVAPRREGGDASGMREPSTPVTTTLTIAGMTAVHAVRAVFTALSGVEGIVRADVAMGRATIEHDGRATAEALRDAVTVAGYELVDIEESRRRLPLL
jgi:copper chaperone CopZ